ncbi:hypothetical protein AB0I98_41430 [Streptomyces sp. NPDC050211]|uniref:hypothetical protein n=1 Tax=Streptomyces sp. NPDC050211 TaxID=3154932 RepID=UPI003445E7AA
MPSGTASARYLTVVESRSGRSRTERRTSTTDSVTVEDVDGALRAWFALHQGDVAVVRPDRYLAALTEPGTWRRSPTPSND